MTRDDAAAIIRTEGLGPIIWFEDPAGKTDSTGIGQDSTGWFTYVTDERAGIRGLERYDTEPEALDAVILRLREKAVNDAFSAAPQQEQISVPPVALQQTQLIREIAEMVGSGIRGPWNRARYVATMTAPVSGFITWVSTEEGEQRTLAPRAASKATKRLRELMYEPGKGTWFTMTMTLQPHGTADTTFDYDNEPDFAPMPIADEAFVTDLRVFPRDAEHVPAWLQAKRGG